jgi:hypothetical protein
MVSKATFHSLALPHDDGNYFLRPDRILGFFVFHEMESPSGATENELAMEDEISQDASTTERISILQRAVNSQGESLHQKQLSRRRRLKGNVDAEMNLESALNPFVVEVKSSSKIDEGIELRPAPPAQFASWLPNQAARFMDGGTSRLAPRGSAPDLLHERDTTDGTNI